MEVLGTGVRGGGCEGYGEDVEAGLVVYCSLCVPSGVLVTSFLSRGVFHMFWRNSPSAIWQPIKGTLVACAIDFPPVFDSDARTN